MNKLSIEDLDVQGKRVLMRVDFNVPQHEDGTVRDDTRIRAALKSINYVRERGGMLILMSHLGRPKDAAKAESEEEKAKILKKNATLKMDPIADKLRELVGGNVKKLDALVGPEVESAVAAMQPGDIIVLENTRFTKGETKNDPELSQQLGKLADLYVLDAFGSAHRAHSSTEGVTKFIAKSAAGFLLKKEMDYFTRVLTNPERPLLAILGGAKIADKIPLINNLLDRADEIIIGGAMAFTFKKVLNNMAIGASLFDAEGAKMVKDLMDKAAAKKVKIHLPVDYICGDKFAEDAQVMSADDGSGIPDGWLGLDVGPKSNALFTAAIARAQTIVWNGPAGVFEYEKFAGGTRAMAEAIAKATAAGAITVVGGGDTATAAKKFKVVDKVTHCSTGGGASLEFLEGKILPGVAALSDKV